MAKNTNNQKRSEQMFENTRISNVKFAKDKIADIERTFTAGHISESFAKKQRDYYNSIIAQNSK